MAKKKIKEISVMKNSREIQAIIDSKPLSKIDSNEKAFGEICHLANKLIDLSGHPLIEIYQAIGMSKMVFHRRRKAPAEWTYEELRALFNFFGIKE